MRDMRTGRTINVQHPQGPASSHCVTIPSSSDPCPAHPDCCMAGWTFTGADPAAFRQALAFALQTYREHRDSFRWGARGQEGRGGEECCAARKATDRQLGAARCSMHAICCRCGCLAYICSCQPERLPPFDPLCALPCFAVLSCRDIQLRGMSQDLSWGAAAQQYEAVLLAAKYQW